MNEAGTVLTSEAGGSIADLVHKLTGPMLKSWPNARDKVRAYRAKNPISVMTKTAGDYRDEKSPANRNVLLIYRASKGCGGETGIRTLDTLRYTRFPSVRLQPLGHLSA
jgi:hypothetical protein